MKVAVDHETLQIAESHVVGFPYFPLLALLQANIDAFDLIVIGTLMNYQMFT